MYVICSFKTPFLINRKTRNRENCLKGAENNSPTVKI